MKKSIFITFITLSFLTLTSCGEGKVKQNTPLVVKVIKVDTIKNRANRSYTFISKPYRATELSFRVGGPVDMFNVQNGQFFRKGDLIANIDDRDYIIRKNRMEAVYNQTKADYKRISNLYEKDNISGASYEKAKADYEKAEADYQDAINDLNDTKLYAPFDGYVQTVYIERYQDVKPSQPVVSFIDLSKIKVESYIPEEIAAIYKNDKNALDYQAEFNTIHDKKFKPAEIYLTQSTEDDNLSYMVTAIFNNESNMLMGGMSGKIMLGESSSNSVCVSVPQTAVCQNDQIGSFVWKVSDGNKVNAVPVRMGKLLAGNKVEIISGLRSGERIATTRLPYLSENVDIIVEE